MITSDGLTKEQREGLSQMKTNYEKLQEEIHRFMETPEAKKQGHLFRNWVTLIDYASLPECTCPKCEKPFRGMACCGLSLKEMIDLAAKQLQEHSQVTKVAYARIEEELRRLENEKK